MYLIMGGGNVDMVWSDVCTLYISCNMVVVLMHI